MSKPEPNAEREIAHQEEPVLPSPREIPAPATGEISANLEPDPMAQEVRNGLESALQEARRSEAELRRLIDTIPTLAWSSTPDCSFDFVNQRWVKYTGLSPEVSYGWGWKAVIHSEDFPELMAKWEALRNSDDAAECEVRLRRFDGMFRWFLFRRETLRDEAHSVTRWYGTGIDIHDAKLTGTLRTAENKTLEMIANGAGLSDVLNTLCAAIDDHASAVSFVCLMDGASNQLLPIVGPRVPPAFAMAITPWSIGPNRGSCGTAAFTKSRVVIPDISDDPRWPDETRGLALSHGFRAAWSEPLISKDGEVLGTFCISHAQPRTPSQQDLEMIEAAGHIARIAIERQRSQEALRTAIDDIRNSEARLRKIIDTIPTLAWCSLPDGTGIFWNRRWHEYTGLPLDAVSGWGWQEAIHPEDLKEITDKWRRFLTSGQPGEVEGRLRRFDGVYRWFLFRAEPLRDESGNIVNWYGTDTDIDDLKRAETKLRQEQEELRRMIDAIPQTIIVLNPDGRATYANRMALDYTGLSLDEIRADDFRARVFHPDDVERLREERQKSLSGDVLFENEQRALGKDGRYRWFLIRYNPLLDKNGKVIRWYAAGTDIEDRKQVEEQLRREQDELRAKHELLELAQKAAHAMAFDWYIQKDVNTWSAGQEALYGLSPGTFDGKYESWKKLIHPDDWPIIVKAVKHSHETGNISAEFRVVWPDGSVHWLIARGQMFMDAEARPYRMVGFTADITPRKVAEDALRRSETYLAEAQKLSHTGSWAVDASQMENIYWSPEMYQIFGLDPSPIPPSYAEIVARRLHPEDTSLHATVQQAIRDKTDYDTEYRLILPNGSTKYIHSIGHPVVNASGEVFELVGTAMDVTEQHEARAALETAFEQIKTLKDKLHQENIALREDIARSSMFEEIVGSSPALNRVLAQVEKVASTDSTVLILGETGTGKELIARAIHNRSKRADGAFATVNCAAIPPSLIAAELFGHEKGAFTGAMQRRPGRFESADGGTVFLDEIGELPPEAQVALLRVLQERQLERLGGHQTISVDVRVLAATNRDLAVAVAEGGFRQDLFYRLNVFPIQLPALRDRIGDIPLLVQYLVERYTHKAGKKIRSISKKTLDLFQTYSWPGNVRELQNVVERAVILCEGETFSVDASWLPLEPVGSVSTNAPLVSDLQRREKTIIEEALREAQGRISGPTGAAAKLGLPRQTLESKIERLGIKRRRFKKP